MNFFFSRRLDSGRDKRRSVGSVTVSIVHMRTPRLLPSMEGSVMHAEKTRLPWVPGQFEDLTTKDTHEAFDTALRHKKEEVMQQEG